MNFISSSAIISNLSDIETSIRGSSLNICEDVLIDSFVKIKFVGGLGNIYIGRGTKINSGCVLYSGNGIQIGENVLIASNTTLAPVNHKYIEKLTIISQQGFKKSKGGIIIEEDVWIGAGVVLLDGTVIKKGSVIGAGCIGQLKTEEYGVYVGNPLKLIKWRI